MSRSHPIPEYCPASIEQAADLLANSLRHQAAKADGMVICAIDGRSASGKSTLAKLTQERLEDCAIVHLDDFFLRTEQRTEERLKKPGWNVDFERLIEEVLDPLIRDGEAYVRPFDCRTMKLQFPLHLNAPKILILEGSYSLNDALLPYSTMRVFTTCSPSRQRERIIERNGYKNLLEFESRWIPLEETYFSRLHITDRADLILRLDSQMHTRRRWFR